MSQNTLNEVYDTLKKQAKAEVLSEIQPKLDKLQALGQEILMSLSGKKKPGPKPKKASVKKVGKAKAPKKAAKKPGRKPGKKVMTPRGALEAGIKAILLAAGSEGRTMAQIRDELLNTPTFAGRDPNGIYTMASTKIKKMAVKKVGKTYTAA